MKRKLNREIGMNHKSYLSGIWSIIHFSLSKKHLLSTHPYVILALISIISSLLTFFFTKPYGWYLFGQDSIPFTNQFSFYHNPFYPYVNATYNIYFSLIVGLSGKIFINPATLERFLIIAGTSCSSFGLLDLFYIIVRISGDRKFNFIYAIPALLFYQFNLFTLSVTWPHFLTWSLLMISAPYIMSFFTVILYEGFNYKRFYLTFLTLFVFAPSISNSYLPFFLMLVVVFFIFGLIRKVRTNENKSNMMIFFMVMIIFTLSVTVWANIPSVLSPIYAIQSGYSKNFIVEYFQSESNSTSLLHVLTLSGYSQIGPSSDPWYWLFGMLSDIYYIIIIILPFSFFLFKKYRTLVPIAIIALLAIIFSTGNNPPFGWINYNLLLLKGPFLFLINPYYFTLQFYVLFLSILFFLLITEFIPTLVNILKKQSVASEKHTKLFKREILIGKSVEVFVVIIILLLIFVSFYPFLSNEVYDGNGQSIDIIDLNNGLPQLEHYLKENFTQPIYLSLLVPTSSFQGRTQLTYNNNSTFIDSVGLVSTMDPYPLIFDNSNYISSALENYLSSSNLSGIQNVLRFLHIKYVIYTNHYAHFSYMMSSPDGRMYNMSNIYICLVSQLGSPKTFGSFSLFTVSNVSPMIGIISNPVFVDANLSDFLSFLGGLNFSELTQSEKDVFMSSFLDSSPNDNLNKLSLYKYEPSVRFYDVSNDETSSFLLDNGILANATPFNGGVHNGVIEVNPRLINSAPYGDYTTNMALVNKTLYGNTYSYLKLNSTLGTGNMINISFFPHFNGNGQGVHFMLSYGYMSVDIYIYNYTKEIGGFDALISANFSNQGLYAWNNLLLPPSLSMININLQLEKGYYVKANFSVPTKNYSNFTRFYYGANNYFLNPGVNGKNFEENESISYNGTFSLNAGNFPLSVYNVTLEKLPNINYIVIQKIKSQPIVIPSNISVNFYGSFSIYGHVSSKEEYIYYFDLPNVNWTLSSDTNIYLKISNNSFTNMYLITNVANSTVEFTLLNKSFDPLFFEISVAETLVATSLFIWLYIGKRKKNMRST